MPEITVPVVTDDNVKAEILEAYELAGQEIEQLKATDEAAVKLIAALREQIAELEGEIELGHEEFNALSGLFGEYQRQSNLGNLTADYIRTLRNVETNGEADAARAIWEQIEALVK